MAEEFSISEIAEAAAGDAGYAIIIEDEAPDIDQVLNEVSPAHKEILNGWLEACQEAAVTSAENSTASAVTEALTEISDAMEKGEVKIID